MSRNDTDDHARRRLDEGGAAVFVVDPGVRSVAIIYYPLSLGRNFDELLRVVKGLQTADHFGVQLR